MKAVRVPFGSLIGKVGVFVDTLWRAVCPCGRIGIAVRAATKISNRIAVERINKHHVGLIWRLVPPDSN